MGVSCYEVCCHTLLPFPGAPRWWAETQGAASLALGYMLVPFQGGHYICISGTSMRFQSFTTICIWPSELTLLMFMR